MNQLSRSLLAAGAFCASLGIFASTTHADVKLPHVIGSNMVIQRDVATPVWGWADPGEKVNVKFDDTDLPVVTASEKGEWLVNLPKTPAGGPHKLVIAGKNTIELTNILAGEVWLCSGQSNMEMGVGMCKNGKEEAATADYPNIRLFKVAKKPSGVPLKDLRGGEWKVCTPKTITQEGWGGFSGAGFYFGRELHKKLNVPVGLIDSSWGGTRIEPWTPPAGFAAVHELSNICAEIEKTNTDFEKAKASGKPIKHPLDSEGRPTGLYNGQIHGLVPFAMRGAIWYQGESNNGEGMLYFQKMKALIAGWRKVWNNEDLAFLFVQLAPYKYGNPSALPGIWEAQTAALSIPNTGMAVTVDISTIGDIHPPNKQDIGKRLAAWAMAKTYGVKDIVYSGPLYKSMKVEGNAIRLFFDHVGTGLVSRDGKDLSWFEIAGADKKFVKATAKIDGKTVVVSAEEVKEPQSVRFGWSEIAEPNLSNKENFPASPFRTERPELK